jgi:hypothetical protein
MNGVLACSRTSEAAALATAAGRGAGWLRRKKLACSPRAGSGWRCGRQAEVDGADPLKAAIVLGGAGGRWAGGSRMARRESKARYKAHQPTNHLAPTPRSAARPSLIKAGAGPIHTHTHALTRTMQGHVQGHAQGQGQFDWQSARHAHKRHT